MSSNLDTKLEDIINISPDKKFDYIEFKNTFLHTEKSLYIIIPLLIVFFLLFLEPWFIKNDDQEISIYYVFKWLVIFLLAILILFFIRQKLKRN